MISHLTEDRGRHAEEVTTKASGVGIITNGDGQIFLALSASDEDLADFWEIDEVEALNLAAMITAILGEA